MAASQLSLEEIHEYFLQKGGIVANREVVKHFRKYLTEPASKDDARIKFKRYVNALATTKTEGDEKFLILKPKFSLAPDLQTAIFTSPKYDPRNSIGIPTSPLLSPGTPLSPVISALSPGPTTVPLGITTTSSGLTAASPGSSVFDFSPPVPRQPPPYRPPPALSPQNRPSPSTSLGDASQNNLSSQECSTPKAPPRQRTSDGKSKSDYEQLNSSPLTSTKSHSSKPKIISTQSSSAANFPLANSHPNPSLNLPIINSLINSPIINSSINSPTINSSINSPTINSSINSPLNSSSMNSPAHPSTNSPITTSKTSSMKARPPAPPKSEDKENERQENKQPTSVKEKTQKFNRLASNDDDASPSYKDRKKQIEQKGADEDDSASVSSLDPKKCTEWYVTAAKCDYHELAKLAQQKPRLIKLKDPFTAYTVLHWGAKHGHQDVIKLFAGTYKADVNARSNGGYTPLHIAAKFGHNAVFNLLKDVYRARLDIRDFSGRKPVQYKTTKIDVGTKDIQKKDSGFLRIGSLNVRVKKSTEAFSNFLGVGGGSSLGSSGTNSSGFGSSKFGSSGLGSPGLGSSRLGSFGFSGGGSSGSGSSGGGSLGGGSSGGGSSGGGSSGGGSSGGGSSGGGSSGGGSLGHGSSGGGSTVVGSSGGGSFGFGSSGFGSSSGLFGSGSTKGSSVTPMDSSADNIHKGWGSSDNVGRESGRAAMPAPKAFISKRKSKRPLESSGPNSSPGTPNQMPRSQMNRKSSTQDSDSDSAAGFDSQWSN